MFRLENAKNMLDFTLLQSHHRIPAGLLVTGIGQGVQCQRILVRCDDGFLDQATYDADLFIV
jgi:hypothetical protein